MPASLQGYESETVNHIKQALKHSELAVESDQQANYKDAIRHYQEAISILELEFLNIPLELQEAVKELVLEYTRRKNALSEAIAKPRASPSLQMVQTVHHKPTLSKKIPSSPLMKPYWFLQHIHRLILEGGYLTPRVFLPPNFFFLSKFEKMTQKYLLMEEVCASLEAVKTFVENAWDDKITSTEFIKGLESFHQQLVQTQNSLNSVYPFIPKKKELERSKSFLGLFKSNKIQKPSRKTNITTQNFILKILEILEKTPLLEKATSQAIEGRFDSTISSLLAAISESIDTVLCKVLLKEIDNLLETTLKFDH